MLNHHGRAIFDSGRSCGVHIKDCESGVVYPHRAAADGALTGVVVEVKVKLVAETQQHEMNSCMKSEELVAASIINCHFFPDSGSLNGDEAQLGESMISPRTQ